MVCSNCPFIQYPILVCYIFLKYPFPLGCPTCCHIIVFQSLLWFLLLLWYCLLFLPFCFLFCLFVSFHLHLVRLVRSLSILFALSKNQILVNFFSIFLNLCFIYSLIFIISFLPLKLGFICSFSNLFRWLVRLFI